MRSSAIDGTTSMLCEEQSSVSLISIDVYMALKFGNLAMFLNLSAVVPRGEDESSSRKSLLNHVINMIKS